MNYLKPELLERLAAEYVLGTLHGGARRRFERIMMDSFRARQAVWAWEQQINPMAEAVQAVKPPPRVWRKIKQRINPEPTGAGFLGRYGWQFWSAASTAVAMALVLFIAIQPTSVPPQDQLALFNDAAAQPLWLVTGNTQTGQLSIKPINAQAVVVDNQAFELWMLPSSGQPRSLGLMPVSSQSTQLVLSPQLLSVLQNSSGLAISIEPKGGSPTGQPTGPVVYQAPLISF